MLEDIMEKKPSNRLVQNPNKGSGSETKKSQDASKQLQKTRRREPSNSNGGRLDQNRKSAPQKNKTLDKRPRPRGQYYGGGKESAQVEEFETELGSLYTLGSKKQNLNHLLNFHYAPRGETVRSGPKPSYQYGVKWLMSTQKHKYNKEHFLQANCQFVVRANADYTPYLADPDLLVDWSFIEQIKVSSVESVNCPICLGTPVAGKMTRCGHIYCFPCILHYLALSDKTWRKCPICYEAVHKNDLKSVQVENKTSYNVGQQITFQLMQRERGSLMACPVTQFDIRSSHRPVLAVSETCLDTAFAKLLTADTAEVLALVEKEVKELEIEKVENQGCPELCFIEQALEICAQRMACMEQKHLEVISPESELIPVKQDLFNKETSLNTENLTSDNNIQYESAFDNIAMDKNENQSEAAFDNIVMDKNQNQSEGSLKEENENAEGYENNNRQRYESVSSEGEDLSPTTITAEDIEVFSQQPNITQTKHFYFYQASDGQHVYMHAVNAQMLEMAYGSLSKGPRVLRGRIVEKEAGSMTAELRHRLRYLQHLPVTAQFEVVEVELLPPTVTEDTLYAFRDQLDLRKKRRQKRARDERKREKKIAEVELRQMGRHATPRLKLDSFHHFPQCGISEEEIPPLPPSAASAGSSRTNSPSSRRSVSPVTAPIRVPSFERQDPGPSFAQMLRSSGSTSKPRGWGRPLSESLARPATPPRHMETVDSDGEAAPAPGYRQSFSDAITAALQATSIQSDENNVGQGGKKKKKKLKVLFSTGMACNSK